MKAITVVPGTVDSVKATDVPAPRAEDVPDNRAVHVKILRVGLDGTDREVNSGQYGAAPPGFDYLILGHESFGVVEQVGPDVSELAAGDFVVATVRHPGGSLYDAIGLPDMTTEETYREHGISRVHGFLCERYVEIPERLIKIPPGLRQVGVLLEPFSIAQKGIGQAYEIQRRLKVWRPRRAAVLGTGTLGLLSTLALRLRGLEVVSFGLQPAPYLNSELVESVGARYVSTKQTALGQIAKDAGGFDVIFEASGYSPLVFEAMQALAKNGVLILSSVTGGDRKIEIPSDAINLNFVLGNKVMIGTVNASRMDFEAGVRDMAMSEAQYPGWLERLITRRVAGLDNCPHAVRLLETGPGSIKTIVEVAPLPS
jgi:threonine dehydrogenase-like Zn-dependent dehydrogenase